MFTRLLAPEWQFAPFTPQSLAHERALGLGLGLDPWHPHDLVVAQSVDLSHLDNEEEKYLQRVQCTCTKQGLTHVAGVRRQAE